MILDDEMRAFLEELDRDFIPAVEAEKFVAELREKRPEVLGEWLDERAAQFVANEMATLLRSQRTHERNMAKAREFGRMTAEEEAEVVLSHFTVRFEIDGEHTRRRVADMTGEDHTFVADQYHDAGKRSMMLESFHRSIAKKVGKKRTADVMSEEQYDLQYRSIVRNAA